MDVNSLKMNLGLLDQYTEKAQAGKPIDRSSLRHVLGLVEEQAQELDAFLGDVNESIGEARRQCKV